MIPFDQLLREAVGSAWRDAPAAASAQRHRSGPCRSPDAAQRRRRAPPRRTLQGTLDFIPGVPLKARKLKTDVDAQVFCDQPVATPTHRFVAAAIDAAVILIGFGVLARDVPVLGGSFGAGRMLWIGMARR